ncbi:hypothetical protein HAX54_028314 [Datura stramonium]|uniref:Uncharacterized protein n=1 Tax=Datura stramonium TaxID=4076 RepID=A0ABS8V614_DATST|nr:hypothetical protein [Datura stramonium]
MSANRRLGLRSIDRRTHRGTADAKPRTVGAFDFLTFDLGTIGSGVSPVGFGESPIECWSTIQNGFKTLSGSRITSVIHESGLATRRSITSTLLSCPVCYPTSTRKWRSVNCSYNSPMLVVL